MNRREKALEFEKLVEDIAKQLSPDAKVKHNDKIIGNSSGILRQIDVTIKQSIGASELLIAIECKNHNRRLDITDVEQIYASHQDILANQSVIVSAGGYTEAALNFGKGKKIDMLLVADTRDHSWKRKIHVPILLSVKKLHFNISYSFLTPIKLILPYDFIKLFKLDIYDENFQMIGTVEEFFRNSETLYSLNQGEHSDVSFIPGKYFIFSNGNYHLANIVANIFIEEQNFLHRCELKKVTGFDNVLTGKIICIGEMSADVNLKEIMDDGELIEDINILKQKPSFVARCLIHLPH